MPILIKLSFVFILLHMIFLLFPTFIAGLNYDIEKRKLSPNYSGDHTGLKRAGIRGKMPVPWPIKDSDPRLKIIVNKYNRLTKIFWWSYGIGIPFLIFLGSQLNGLDN